MLANLRAAKDEKYKSNIIVKGLNCAIEKCFSLKKKYEYIAD